MISFGHKVGQEKKGWKQGKYNASKFQMSILNSQKF